MADVGNLVVITFVINSLVTYEYSPSVHMRICFVLSIVPELASNFADA
ncbi:MAG: hypothetical protein MJ223_01480 [Mycoplasmoidaceae bacterium]|nr:hypothetical protein [Mycoplasmoidaceae bacterium]